ncbi:retropepsin-like aspartic protease [Nitrosomonas oligotropha]|uniref:retropepsin-like aspartic protease n=1 Tax=Nitrosomonas oligotropha TaxID=42354 RepID=UPI00136AFA3A|nr:retropepsin-like aspartic protease [Nitrosomonas oligotropha]
MSSHPKVSVSSFDQAFLNGEIRLDCQLLCGMQFGASLSDMHQLYLQQRWHELSRKIIEIGFNQDIAYYYLGRAAEGLGKTKSAEVYYLLSQSAPRCILNGCNGLSFPDVINDRLANIKKYSSAPEVISSSSIHSSQISDNPKPLVTTVSDVNNKSKNECIINSNCITNKACKVFGSNRYECIEEGQATNFELKSIQKNVPDDMGNEIKLISVGGVYEIPVVLNEVLRINVILDSGAADVSISPDVALTLIRTGTIKNSDWMTGQVYQFADGTKSKSKRFSMRSITIGNKTFKNVTCSIAEKNDAPMLLGQSLLKKLGKYTIDYKKGIIQFE